MHLTGIQNRKNKRCSKLEECLRLYPDYGLAFNLKEGLMEKVAELRKYAMRIYG